MATPDTRKYDISSTIHAAASNAGGFSKKALLISIFIARRVAAGRLEYDSTIHDNPGSVKLFKLCHFPAPKQSQTT